MSRRNTKYGCLRGSDGLHWRTFWTVLVGVACLNFVACNGSPMGEEALLKSETGSPILESQREKPQPLGAEPAVQANQEPEPSELELLGFLETNAITTDEELRKFLNGWKARPISLKEKKEVKARRDKWRDPLGKALKHVEPNVRANAAAALASTGKSSSTTKQLLSAMREELDGDVRGHIAKVFVDYKAPEATDALVKVMRTDENPSARANAAWALSKHGTKDASQAFVEALDDPESWVRLYAVNGVKKFRVKKAIPGLRRLLSDSSGLVAKKAKETLKSLGAR